MKNGFRLIAFALAMTMLCTMLTGFTSNVSAAAGAETVKVAYIPIDNRPVNYQRVQYLAQSVGIELLMPDEDLFRTALDNMEPNSNGTRYGDREALLAWLKSVESSCDYYVISLDQMLSGGLVASRWLSNTDLTLETKIADYIIGLAERKKVVLFDTVMRLASTVNFDGYQMNEYNSLRSYGAKSRRILTGSALTVDNIISGYRYDTAGNVISSSLSSGKIDAYIASRSRKLRLADYILRNATEDIDFCYIGVDDSSPGNTIQTNEIAYIRTLLGSKGACYGATDEFGLMGIARVAYLLYGSAKVNVTYYGGGENEIADGFDFETLKVNTSSKLVSLGCTESSDASALRVLIMSKSNYTETAVSSLIAQAKSNIDNCIPTVIIDPSRSSAGTTTLETALVDSEIPLTILLGYSNWNTAGNALGIALSLGIARYLYLTKAEKVTPESNDGFVKSMTFAYLKDISYKCFRASIDNPAANTEYGYRHLLYRINTSPMISRLGTLYSTISHKTVVCSNYRYPWNRTFEMLFDINLDNSEIVPYDPDGTSFFNYAPNATVPFTDLILTWFPSVIGNASVKCLLLGGEPQPTNVNEANTEGTVTLLSETNYAGTSITIPMSSLVRGKWLKIAIGTSSDGWKTIYLFVAEGMQAYDKGDINGDARITAHDYLYCKRIFLRTYTPTEQQFTAADVNGDGRVNAIDYLRIKRTFFYGG